MASDLVRGYEVWHKDDIARENVKKLRTLRTMTPRQVKEKLVSAGLFERENMCELRVKRIGR